DPVIGYTVTGWQFDDGESLLTGTLSREAGEDAGTYLITGGDLSAGDNYAIAIAEEVFSVGRAELMVKADTGQSKVYGSLDPVLTFEATGFERDDDENVFTGTLVRATGEGVDTYTI